MLQYLGSKTKHVGELSNPFLVILKKKNGHLVISLYMLLASIANNMNTDQIAYRCIVTLWLFLTVPWVGLQFIIGVFPDHTQLLFQSVCLDPDRGSV